MKSTKLLALALSLMTATAPMLAQAADTNIPTNNVKIGQKSTANKSITFDMNAGTANPKLRATSSGLQFANDGINFLGIGSGGSSGGLNINQNSNPDFEQGLAGYTPSSAGTLTLASSGSSLLRGNGSAIFTPTAAAQYIDFPSVVAPNGINGQCEFDIYYRFGQDAIYTLQVYDGSSNILAQRLIDLASSGGRDFGVPFACVPGGTYKARILASASATAIAFDTVYVGTNKLASFLDAVPTKVTVLTGSGTFVKDPNTRWIRVYANGAGGGGGGSGSGSTSGGNASASTFGPITVNGGSGGAVGSGAGGAGGSVTALGTGAVGYEIPGANGGDVNVGSSAFTPGGAGAGTPFAGSTGSSLSAGRAGATGSGAGGGGAGSGSAAIGNAAGGGAGAYAVATIAVPASSISYSCSVGGTAGAAGSSGQAGGAGADCRMVVEEYGYASGQAFTPQGGGLQPGDIVSGAWTSCPTGTIAADGSAISRTLNATLFGAISTTYGVGDGSTTFNVPNMSGVFARGAGSQTIGGVTYTGTQGTSQGDQFQGHTHSKASSVGSSNVGRLNGGGDGVTNLSTTDVGPATTDGTNGTPRTGLETRPANISLKYCIRTVAASPAPILVGPFSQMPSGAITSSTYTTLASDSIVDTDTTLNAVAVTLASPAGLRGKSITISKKNSGANLVSITGLIGGSTITTYLHRAGEFDEFYSDGSSWQWRSESERDERVSVTSNCTASPCTIAAQSGSWIGASSLTRSSTGVYLATFVSGLFSSAPVCIITGQGTVDQGVNCKMSSTPPTSSSALFICTNAAASGEDSPFAIRCRGPR